MQQESNKVGSEKRAFLILPCVYLLVDRVVPIWQRGSLRLSVNMPSGDFVFEAKSGRN